MPGKRICINPLPEAAARRGLDAPSVASLGENPKDGWGWRKPSPPPFVSLSSSPCPPRPEPLSGAAISRTLVSCVAGNDLFQTGFHMWNWNNGWQQTFLNPWERWHGSQQSLARHHTSQLSHASKGIINPIMIEILMRCALESDFGVIIRAILPVVESWSWTEACAVAQSEGKKCCYACRSCSHLCLNQQLYIICFFLLRESLLTPLCLLGSTSPSDSSDQNDCSTSSLLLLEIVWAQTRFQWEKRGWGEKNMAYCHNNIQNDRSLMSHDALLQYYLDDCESRSPQTIQRHSRLLLSSISTFTGISESFVLLMLLLLLTLHAGMSESGHRMWKDVFFLLLKIWSSEALDWSGDNHPILPLPTPHHKHTHIQTQKTNACVYPFAHNVQLVLN